MCLPKKDFLLLLMAHWFRIKLLVSRKTTANESNINKVSRGVLP